MRPEERTSGVRCERGREEPACAGASAHHDSIMGGAAHGVGTAVYQSGSQRHLFSRRRLPFVADRHAAGSWPSTRMQGRDAERDTPAGQEARRTRKQGERCWQLPDDAGRDQPGA